MAAAPAAEDEREAVRQQDRDGLLGCLARAAGAFGAGALLGARVHADNVIQGRPTFIVGVNPRKRRIDQLARCDPPGTDHAVDGGDVGFVYLEIGARIALSPRWKHAAAYHQYFAFGP